MAYIKQWSRSHVERLMDISTTLGDFTQSLELSKNVPAYLSKALGVEPITLAIIEQPLESDARVVLSASSGQVATGEAGATFHQQLLYLHRQTRPVHGAAAPETASLRLAELVGQAEAGCFELALPDFPLYPRALVFAHTLNDSHRMCLIVHEREGGVLFPEGMIDSLAVVATQLAKLLKCAIECAEHPEILGGPFNRLTEREWVVLQGLNSEDGEKQLADRLSLSPHTLHSHIKSIYRKVGVQGRLPLLLRLHEAQRDLRMTSMNGRTSASLQEMAKRAVAVG